MIELVLLPLLTGIALIAALAPLGCFVLWRKMAFFGDTIAHSMLIGIALGITLEINLSLAIIGFASLLAFTLVFTGGSGAIPRDTLLSIVSHSSLALGLLAMSLLTDQRLNLMNFLLGDILSVTTTDLILIGSAALWVVFMLSYCWRALLGLVIHPELSEVEGDNTTRLNILLMLSTALVIAIAVRIVGVLLITALMVIPAASARLISRSPEAMVGFSFLFSLCALLCGISFSFMFNSATGPTIVSSAAVLLVLTASVTQLLKLR